MERMDFKSFCNAVVNGIAEYLLQYEIESIRLETVCHNNGVEHVGLDLVPERASASAFGNRQTLKVNTGRAIMYPQRFIWNNIISIWCGSRHRFRMC